jgi:hypothetical protein
MTSANPKRRFENMPDGELADQFGEAAEASKRHRSLRSEILARGSGTLRGDEYVVFATTKPSTIFNHARCRKILGDEAYEALWELVDTTWVQAGRLVDDDSAADDGAAP